MGKYSEDLNKRNGYCVICGQYGKLTKDHVPPKACNNDSEIVLRTFNNDKHCHDKNFKRGVHFKTICEKCNNELLGAQYDPELVRLSREITNIALSVSSNYIILPPEILVFIKPQRVARAIIGHFLAAHSLKEAKDGVHWSPFNNALREYFLSTTAHLPEGVDIYFWLYPNRRQVIMKHWVKATLGNVNNTSLYGGILKFLPLGFLILWEKPAILLNNLTTLVQHKSMDMDETCQVRINLANFPPSNFPETPSGQEVMLSCVEYASHTTQRCAI